MIHIQKAFSFFAVLMVITVPAIAQNIGIGTNNPTNKLEVISEVVAAANASISGTNNGTTGSAVMGISNAAGTRGVTGQSADGVGVQGYTNTGTGVNGMSFSGNALSATSNTGYALVATGNVRIAGGNTNPSKGAVLTSDAAGNATWKKSNIAFSGEGTLATVLPNGLFKKLELVTEPYDLQNNFEVYNGLITPGSSVFTAPVAGVYHFSANVAFGRSDGSFFSYGQLRLVKNGTAIATVMGNPVVTQLDVSRLCLQLTGDYHLAPNDKIWIEVFQLNSAGSDEPADNDARFNGHIVTAD